MSGMNHIQKAAAAAANLKKKNAKVGPGSPIYKTLVWKVFRHSTPPNGWAINQPKYNGDGRNSPVGGKLV